MLRVTNFHASISGKEILNGVNLKVDPGKIHVLMGPNGSGKSSLSYALMGHPSYNIHKSSQAELNGVSLLDKTPDDRAKLGLFLAFQHPISIPGVSVQNALRTAYEAVGLPKISVTTFRDLLKTSAASLGLNPEFLARSVNDGFSGGEKKRLEMLTLLTLKPKIAILDETDSGLDIDSIKLVAKAIKVVARKENTGILVVTHYRRILEFVSPDTVSVMVKGKIVISGGPVLIDVIEESGYKQFS